MSTQHEVHTRLLKMQARQGNGVVFIIKYTPLSGELRTIAGRVFGHVDNNSFTLFDGRNEPDISIDEVKEMREVPLSEYLEALANSLWVGGGVLTVKRINGTEINTQTRPIIRDGILHLEDGDHQIHKISFDQICGVPWISRLS